MMKVVCPYCEEAMQLDKIINKEQFRFVCKNPDCAFSTPWCKNVEYAILATQRCKVTDWFTTPIPKVFDVTFDIITLLGGRDTVELKIGESGSKWVSCKVENNYYESRFVEAWKINREAYTRKYNANQ